MRNSERSRPAASSSRSTSSTLCFRYSRDAATDNDTPSAICAASFSIPGRIAITSIGGGGPGYAFSLKLRNSPTSSSRLTSRPDSAVRNASMRWRVRSSGRSTVPPSLATRPGSPTPTWIRMRPGPISHSEASSMASAPGWRLAADSPTRPISNRCVAWRYIALGTIASWKPRCSAVQTPSKPRSSAARTASTVPSSGPKPVNAKLSRMRLPPFGPPSGNWPERSAERAAERSVGRAGSCSQPGPARSTRPGAYAAAMPPSTTTASPLT